MVVQAFLITAVLVTAVAAWVDWREGTIPPWLTAGALILAPIAHGVYGWTTGGFDEAWRGAAFSIAGAVVCALIPMFLYAKGGLGGGDVKLLAALGAILRPMIGLEAEFYGFIIAALYAPARLAYEGKLMQTIGNTVAIVANPFLPKPKRREIVPEMLTWQRLGPAIFAGTCVSVLMHWSMP